MRTICRTVDGVAILDLVGPLQSDIVASHVSAATHHTVRGLVLINLAGARCRGIDDVNALLGAWLVARRIGSDLKLFGVTPHLGELPSIVALCTHFDIYDTEDEALKHSYGNEHRFDSPEAA